MAANLLSCEEKRDVFGSHFDFSQIQPDFDRTARIKFVTLEPRHAREMAKLHIEGINTGFISSLGLDFVTALYEGIIESKDSFGFVSEDDKVLGFVAFTTSVSRIYKYIILKKGMRFAFLLARKMLSFEKLKKVFETLFYPVRVKKMNLPEAELLSIVVSGEIRRHGQATELIQQGFEEYHKKGIDQVKVMVSASNYPANKLYEKCGFKLASQIDSHGVLSNIYVAEIAEAAKLCEPKTVDIPMDYRQVKYPAKAAVA